MKTITLDLKNTIGKAKEFTTTKIEHFAYETFFVSGCLINAFIILLVILI